MKKYNNDVVLFISDLHAPYEHKDAIAFLAAIKQKYKPTRIVNVGDEVDYHALSFHASDPDLDSAGMELIKAQATMAKLEQLFPEMDLIHSNHGSMVYRKQKHHGLPRHVIKSYREILQVGEGWMWHTDLTLNINGHRPVYVCHGKKKNSENYAKSIGCSVVQGHYHEDFRVGYLNSPGGIIWGMNVGCLIDDTQMAFEYNKVNPNKPMIGTGIIINGIPKLIPMILDEKGNWNGKL